MKTISLIIAILFVVSSVSYAGSPYVRSSDLILTPGKRIASGSILENLPGKDYPPSWWSNRFNIMPLGDSITYGMGSTNGAGYRGPLYLMLKDAGYNVDFVGSRTNGNPIDFDSHHEGHPGKTADYIRDNVYDYLQANPADIVLLDIGINDLRGGGKIIFRLLKKSVRSLIKLIDTKKIHSQRLPSFWHV